MEQNVDIRGKMFMMRNILNMTALEMHIINQTCMNTTILPIPTMTDRI